MQDWPILSVITFLPLAGVVFILLLARGDKEYTDRNAKFMALWTSIVTFLFSLILWFRFDVSKASFQFVEKTDWMSLPGGYTLTYHMGVDGISMLFVLLTTLLTPICVLASWGLDQGSGARVHDRVPGARDPDDRHLLRAQPGHFLHLL